MEGGSVQGNWLISSWQLGWEELTALVLRGWKAAAALGSLVLDPYLIPSRTERGRAKSLKGKRPVEKEMQPRIDKRALSQHCFSSLCSQRDCSRGPWAQGGFTPHLHKEPGSSPQLAASPLASITPAHQPAQGSVLCTALAHLIWVERGWGAAAGSARHQLK